MKAFSGESFNRVTRNTRLHLFGYEGSFSFLRECFVPLVIHPVVSDPSWAQRRRQQPFLSFTLGLLPGAFALRCVMMIRFLVAFFQKSLIFAALMRQPASCSDFRAPAAWTDDPWDSPPSDGAGLSAIPGAGRAVLGFSSSFFLPSSSFRLYHNRSQAGCQHIFA